MLKFIKKRGVAKGSVSFQAVVVAVFGLFALMELYPFINALAYSLSDGNEAYLRNVTIFPVAFTLDNYRAVFRNAEMMRGLIISAARVLTGIVLHMTITGMASYALSKKDLMARRYLLLFFLLPIYLNGGLIPYFIQIRNLRLMNNFLVYIVPAMFNSFEMLLMKTYFETLPEALEDSAKLDGAGTLRIFLQIIIPLSAPIIATIVLFHGVYQWNAWFDAMMFVTNSELMPLQMILQRILFEQMGTALSKAMSATSRTNITPETIKMTALIVSTVPILCIYPFLQKYYVKGIMIGAIKA